jgi:adenylate kinase
MQPQSFIFIGRSGSGKGTQAELLSKVLNAKDPSRKQLYVQTGQEIRQFIQGNTKTEKLAKEFYDTGGLFPEFIAVYMWVKALVERYTGDEHIIFDGTPRKIREAEVLDSAFGFYGMGKPWVINIDVPDEESLKRLLIRKRLDDEESEIKKRLAWYETDVVPTIEYYKNNPRYNFIVIDGHRKIEEIHADIVQKVGLL